MTDNNPTLDVLLGAKYAITPECKTTKVMLEGLVSAYKSSAQKQEAVLDVDTLVRQLVGIIADLEMRILNLEKQISTPHPSV